MKAMRRLFTLGVTLAALLSAADADLIVDITRSAIDQVSSEVLG